MMTMQPEITPGMSSIWYMCATVEKYSIANKALKLILIFSKLFSKCSSSLPLFRPIKHALLTSHNTQVPRGILSWPENQTISQNSSAALLGKTHIEKSSAQFRLALDVICHQLFWCDFILHRKLMHFVLSCCGIYFETNRNAPSIHLLILDSK